MRGLADLPEDTRPHFDRSALVTVDVQRDVLDGGALEIPGTSDALGTMAELARAFRRSGRPIVHVVRLYLADGSNADLSRRSLVSSTGPLLRPDTPGCQIAPPLLPDGAPDLDVPLLLAGTAQALSDTESVMYKSRWGAFYDTGLEALLRAEDVDTLVVCGANFPNCPRTTVYEASERDFRVVLVADAVSGLYDRGADELRAIGVAVVAARTVVAAFGTPGRDLD